MSCIWRRDTAGRRTANGLDVFTIRSLRSGSRCCLERARPSVDPPSCCSPRLSSSCSSACLCSPPFSSPSSSLSASSPPSSAFWGLKTTAAQSNRLRAGCGRSSRVRSANEKRASHRLRQSIRRVTWDDADSYHTIVAVCICIYVITRYGTWQWMPLTILMSGGDIMSVQHRVIGREDTGI